MIIKEISYSNKVIELCGKNNNGINTFTILVGRNGCGKSTALKKICLINLTSALSQTTHSPWQSNLSNYLDRNENSEIDNTGCLTYEFDGATYTISVEHHNSILSPYSSRENTLKHSIDSYHVSGENLIPKLIAVSSSPFDKFPIFDKFLTTNDTKIAVDRYIYRGARTNSRNSQKSFLTSKFDQLGSSFLNLFLNTESRKNEIFHLFNYLGLAPQLKLILSTDFHFSFEDFLSENGKGSAQAIKSARFFKGAHNHRDEEISTDTMEKIIKSVETIYKHSNNTNDAFTRTFSYALELDITSESKVDLLQEFATLAEYDLINLENIEFIKAKNDSSFLLTDASSGELCILFNILSIAGAITDHSVILLDEPELSLHPEWQNDFLPLIERIFAKYKGCHFIIATHSPQIVSSMSQANSYIVNLEDNPAKVIDSSQISLQSSDYQLAYIFKAPGHRNEYLISKIIDALSQIRDGRQLDSTFFLETQDLLRFSDLVPTNDPVQKLLSTLKKALRVIAND